MSLIEQISAAIPRQEEAEFEISGQKFPVKVLVVSMADYRKRMKCFDGDEAQIAGEMSGWFFTPEGERAFAPEDFEKLPAKAVKSLVALFSRVNTGIEAKNA